MLKKILHLFGKDSTVLPRSAITTPIEFRPNSHDESIFHTVHTHNEYHLPDRLSKSDIVIDIGAHIGSFGYTVLERGAGYVLAYEAEIQNYKITLKNLSQYGTKAKVCNQAVWRSDRDGDKLFHTGYTQYQGKDNTGGGNVIWATGGVPLDTVSLNTVILTIANEKKARIRLIKVDVEGAEFPILLTASELGHVDNICGEFHEMGGQFDQNTIPNHTKIEGYESFTIDSLANALKEQGFDVSWQRHRPDSHLGMFFAGRPEASLWPNK